jgi:hypothetical protein
MMSWGTPSPLDEIDITAPKSTEVRQDYLQRLRPTDGEQPVQRLKA